MILSSRRLKQTTRRGVWLGGVFLLSGMMLLMSNIFGRFIHFVIPGSYEMFELIMTVPVGIGLVLAALHGIHVTVDLVVAQFPSKIRAVAEIIAFLLTLITWAAIVYASADLAFQNGLREASEVLGIPFLPFRIVWVICLFLFCLDILVNLIRSIRRLILK